MNRVHYEHIDRFLKFLAEKENFISLHSNYDAAKEYQGKYSVNLQAEFNHISSEIIEKYALVKLLEKSNTTVILLPEGEKAANMGFEKYLKELNYNVQLDKEAKIATIDAVLIAKKSLSKSNLAIILSIIAIVVAIVLGIFPLIFKSD